MCNCWRKHPTIHCGDEGCHCHDEEKPVLTPEQTLRLECLKLACVAVGRVYNTPDQIIDKAQHFEVYVRGDND